MNEKTKKILIRRRIREVITVKQNEPKAFVCKHCGKEQNFKLVENANNKLLIKGDNNDENHNKQL
jgi:transcription elongation factor Elf1